MGSGGDLLAGRFGRGFATTGLCGRCAACARRGGEPAETVDEAFGFGLGGESFGEQLLVALRLGDRVDPADLAPRRSRIRPCGESRCAGLMLGLGLAGWGGSSAGERSLAGSAASWG